MRGIGQVDRLLIYTLIEDSAGYNTQFLAQHGISILLDVVTGDAHNRIVMDVGQSATPILHNMEILGLEPATIDMVFLSHCHDDHTKGLVGMLQAINKSEIPVIAHPTLFRPNFVLQPHLRHIGVTEENSQERVKGSGGRLVLVRDPLELAPGVLSTGEVQRTTDYEVSKVGAYNVEDAGLVEDAMLDDMSLAVNVRGKGLVIVTGCAHAGIVNITRHAIKVSGVQRIEGLIGGLHLIDASEDKIKSTVRDLLELHPRWVRAGHCTGFVASQRLSAAFGDSFDLLHAGSVIHVDGQPDG